MRSCLFTIWSCPFYTNGRTTLTISLP